MYTVDTPIQLRFADTDALGHVNNAALVTYLEIGRLDYFARFPGFVQSLILARLAVDFRRQVRLEDQVVVQTSLEQLGTSSITLRQVVLAGGEVAVECRSVVVHFDYDAQRSVPVPAAIREALA
jgi:acyl-CoA thioester hydrolase